MTDPTQAAMEKQLALVRDALPDIVLMMREYGERGQRGFALFVEDRPYQFCPAALIRNIDWPTPETCNDVLAMCARYTLRDQFVLVTVTSTETLVATYHYALAERVVKDEP